MTVPTLPVHLPCSAVPFLCHRACRPSPRCQPLSLYYLAVYSVHAARLYYAADVCGAVRGVCCAGEWFLCLHRLACTCACAWTFGPMPCIPCHTSDVATVPSRICTTLLAARIRLFSMLRSSHTQMPLVHGHRTPRIPQATGRPTLSASSLPISPFPPAPSVLARYFNGVPPKNLLPYTTRVASGVRCVHSAWPPLSVGHGPEHLNSPANTYYQARPVITMTSSLVTTHWGRVPSVHRVYYPVLAWPINLQAYAMPSVPVPPITLI